VKALENVIGGNEKNCELLPTNTTLFDPAPNGPVAWDVGEEADVLSEPATPDTSVRIFPLLNG
jgi:hypothetical protein